MANAGWVKAASAEYVGRDPREFLGMDADDVPKSRPRAVVHFRKKKTVKLETANALGELILAAQRAVQARDELLGR
jgi:hypothetical protein